MYVELRERGEVEMEEWWGVGKKSTVALIDCFVTT